MKRWVAGSALIVLGLVIVLIAALGAAAQTTGTCYVALAGVGPCTSSLTATMTCDECLELTFPSVSWQGTGDCLTAVEDCPVATAVTFLGVETPITSCNAGWAVPGLALFGMVVAAGGIVMLKRQRHAG